MDKSTVVRLGLRRVDGAAREWAYLKLGMDFTRPDSIRATINHRCNYKCPYCYSWQRTEYPEISIEQWKKGLLSLREYIGKYTIQFSGGEPFLKKGFTDLLTFCRDNDIRWGVISNGSVFVQSVVSKVVDALPLNIDISIDSPDPAANDLVRGAKESVQVIGAGIRRLADERRKKRAKFLIRVKPTVTAHNVETLPTLVDWATECGADIVDFSVVRPEEFWTKETYANVWVDESRLAKLSASIERLICMKNSGAAIETSIEKLLSFVPHFQGLEVKHGAVPCRVGMRDYFISPTGDVNMCWEYPVIGNITQKSAREIWQGPLANSVRGDTVKCSKFGTIICANSCRTHRTIKQEISRALRWL
jgi:radical SAM protein with 4Fe4S-binding SPASM domain